MQTVVAVKNNRICVATNDVKHALKIIIIIWFVNADMFYVLSYNVILNDRSPLEQRTKLDVYCTCITHLCKKTFYVPDSILLYKGQLI